jgi:hypothetical protein
MAKNLCLIQSRQMVAVMVDISMALVGHLELVKTAVQVVVTFLTTYLRRVRELSGRVSTVGLLPQATQTEAVVVVLTPPALAHLAGTVFLRLLLVRR